MSFSSDVRNELSLQMSGKRHCRLAELSALLSMCGSIAVSAEDHVSIRLTTENLAAARKFYELVRKLQHISCEVRFRISSAGKHLVCVAVPRHEDALRILQETCMMPYELDDSEAFSDQEPGPAQEIRETSSYEFDNSLEAEVYLEDALEKLLTRSCCRRAYLRGAFLAAGSISDPRKYYHLEITAFSMERALQLQRMMESFGLDAKIVERKHQFVVYIKEGAQIVEMLGVMKAPKALLEMENIRILREISGNVNRQVNCETANLNKTVGAAVRQIDDIRYLQQRGELEQLPAHLREMAMLRLTYPEMALKDLGQELDPPLSKAGVNHRLRKLSEIADDLRGTGEKERPAKPGNRKQEE